MDDMTFRMNVSVLRSSVIYRETHSDFPSNMQYCKCVVFERMPLPRVGLIFHNKKKYQANNTSPPHRPASNTMLFVTITCC